MQLTSQERMRRAIKGEPIDRTALAYLFFGGASHVLAKMGQDLRSVHADPDLMAAAQATAAQLFGHDSGMLPWGCLTVEAEAFGCTLEMSSHQYPRVVRRPLEDSTPRLAGLKKIDPGNSGRMPLVLEALTRLRQRSGGDLFIIAMVVAPFLVAAEVRGMAELLTDFAVNPAFAEDLCEQVTEGVQAYLQAILQTRACDAVMFENAGATRELMGSHHLERFVLAYHRRLLATARNQAPEVLLIEHNCSNKPYFREILELDIDAVSFAYGDVDAIHQRHNWDCLAHHTTANACSQRFCLTPQPGEAGNDEWRNTQVLKNDKAGMTKDNDNNRALSPDDLQGSDKASIGCEATFEV